MCDHESLTCLPSTYAAASGHRTITTNQLLAAATGKRTASVDDHATLAPLVYPVPLVLPGDDIDCDPNYPPQSFREWLNLGVRNLVSSRRNVIYLAAPPDIDDSVAFMRDWQHPTAWREATTSVLEGQLNIEIIAAYLRAFYYGLEVQILPQRLTFTSWEDTTTSTAALRGRGRGAVQATPRLQYVGLSTDSEVVRIRARPTPPVGSASPPELFPYPYQLDLNDLTDFSMSILPSDAYALLLMTTHDLYESDADDFCCGRAWGASRVAIVSSARYHAALDKLHDIDIEHVWPASHCAAFVRKMSAEIQTGVRPRNRRRIRGRQKKQDTLTADSSGSATPMPLQKALDAHRHAVVHQEGMSRDKETSALSFRLCRTVSHELGHCFGLDHCMYRACVMQGSASVAEDVRQPPYLCPVCDRKIAWAITQSGRVEQEGHLTDGSRSRNGRGKGERGAEEMIAAWKRGRCLAMKHFGNLQGGSFAAMAAWYEGMLEVNAAGLHEYVSCT
ncbi:hypothetical protein PV08_00807 [Exophiala spinifera]|uniref:Uncharacterized protein n=1 Tax=Exophiala spinifera TaxID=91928 RepID=A0A0D2A618_9EURO|nr:uncharacterized protein PV08_00807 [Exophiala spinifera]KIW20232.1 hypothetical protein PV08_00807 [Exophiala spinifera]